MFLPFNTRALQLPAISKIVLLGGRGEILKGVNNNSPIPTQKQL